MKYWSILGCCLFSLIHIVAAQPAILFMQQPAVSPDGRWIAFAYKSNIYKVPVGGGAAIPLTMNNAYNGYPVWSHDGRQLAFASNRYGSFDVYVMPADGGIAKRLTYHAARDIPFEFSKDDSKVLFGTDRHDVATSVRFPADYLWTKLFAVPVAGGKSVLVNSAGTDHARWNATGDQLLFQDRKGVEDVYRKHHRSPVTRDIWCFDRKTNRYAKLTGFDGEDIEPVWGKGDAFYFLSERDGTMNVYRSEVHQPAQVEQLTTFTKDPVRNLSRADNGLLVFTQQGALYTMMEGGKPDKISVLLGGDFNDEQVQTLPVNGGASEMSVSPNGKEVAYVYHGEIFVTAVDGSGTKRVTNTAYEEKMVQFSPDGRTLLYSVEVNGSWDIYSVTIAHGNEAEGL